MAKRFISLENCSGKALALVQAGGAERESVQSVGAWQRQWQLVFKMCNETFCTCKRILNKSRAKAAQEG